MNTARTFLAAAIATAGLPFTGAFGDSFDDIVQPVLRDHCSDCHGAEKQKGGVRFDRASSFRGDDLHLWTLVYGQLSAGEMPPEGRPGPSVEEKRAVLAWIENEQRTRRADSTRRLNRRELSALLRDLTGLSVDYAAALPGDGKVAGFDTGAAGLQDSADSVARVLEITRRAVEGIRFLEPPRGKTFVADLRESKDRKGRFDARPAFEEWKDGGAYVKVRGVGELGKGLYIEPKWLGDRGGFSMNVPPPEDGRGVVRIKALVSSTTGKFDGVPDPHLWLRVGGTTFDMRELAATAGPRELVYEVQVDDLPVEARGLSVVLINRVEVPYRVAGFENEDRSKPKDEVPGGTGLFRPAYDRKKKAAPEEKPVPWVILGRLEIETDYVAVWPPERWQVDVGEIGDDRGSAARLLALWIDRAWRRPSTAEERDRFLALYDRVRAKGASFDDALRAAFQSALLSAPARELVSPKRAGPGNEAHAIASRLSFFLHGAPPDRALRAKASAGTLREPSALAREVDRLLDDPRREAFFRSFIEQWLVLGQPITIAMDHLKKQDFRFGRHLKASMHEETIAYITRLFIENRPARELVASDWTMMNDILARHYGYEGIRGETLRPVTIRGDDPRGGGLFAHAGIQSMLCWMGENWVIYRGAWTLRHILDDPPPPPPLEVPELIPSDDGNRGKSFRELLDQHQKDENCSVCHKKMDPLGFAFQNFDISGRWRDVEFERYERNEIDGKIAWRGAGATRPVDASGVLPRGERFTSFAQFKNLVVEHYLDDLVRGLLKNLVIYSTGRKPDVADMAEIRSIQARERPRGYRLRNLLKGIVQSRAFLEAEGKTRAF